MDQLPKFLEPALHLLLLGIAVGVAWSYWPSGSMGPSEAGPTIHVDSSAVLSTWRPAERRVFLFVSPTCPYCNRSMGFYAQLSRVADSLQQGGGPVALAAVISRSASSRAQRKVLRDSSVSVDTLFSLSPDTLRSMGVTSVPTVAVASPGESRLAVWVGLQDSTGEREILSALRRR